MGYKKISPFHQPNISPMSTTMTQPSTILKQYFGYDEFRPMQEEIIQTVMEGRDSVVLMPTGGGKSICFQVPALAKEGLCVVVSPLIALMKDQVEGLVANGVPAAFLNSTQDDHDQMEVFDAVRREELKLLYVSPEKLLNSQFLGFLQGITLSLFAIDEAHCISSWGHDFRKEYTQLQVLKATFPQVPIIALTATADKLTRKDIVTQLGLHQPRQFVASFDRPNLSLTVLPGRKRVDAVIRFIQKRPNTSGIIYCLSRKGTEGLAESLQKAGIDAEPYHAGMSASKRSKVQQAFIQDRTPIICATIAFGMGIDKSNVRWVIHYNLPKNIEGYYQEIGRAGRDGLASDTLLFYTFADVMKLRGFAEDSGQPAVQLAKLERMQNYAEALICRRKILLAYFGEHLAKDCGNCDVCKDPPQYVDGTILAQKALSAVYRLRETVGANTVIDVLRGSARKEVLEKGYDKIKTYGAGADISFGDWQQYLLQMLNAGLLEIAYDQGNALKLTPIGNEVLFKGRKVNLYRLADARKREKAQAAQKPKSKRMILIEALFEQLRELRLQLASQSGIPPYLVFNDATLQEMAAERPTNEALMKGISGVSEAKFRQYGHIFIEEIIRFILDQRAGGANIKGSTYIETFDLYRQGFTVSEMARKRSIHPSTIYGHLGTLYEQGYRVELNSFISQEELDAIHRAMSHTGSEKVSDLHEHLQGMVPFDKLRLGISYWKAGG